MQTDAIEDLVKQFARLPGLGSRSARRVVLHLLRAKEKQMIPLTQALAHAIDSVRACSDCGNLDAVDPCHICADARRDNTVICVVEEVADLWAIERCRLYKGLYHVLGGTLSAIDDRGPAQMNIESLLRRVSAGDVKEIILATNATVEGQTTAHYITSRLAPYALSISRLAQGIPMGGELDYLDDGTLSAALSARLPF